MIEVMCYHADKHPHGVPPIPIKVPSRIAFSHKFEEISSNRLGERDDKQNGMYYLQIFLCVFNLTGER